MNLRKLREAEEAFLRRYPGGFNNSEIIAIRNRKHKPDQMIALAQESFSKGNFRLPEQIVRNMEKVIRHSSIVSVFEKLRFKDFINELPPQNRDLLASSLEELLHRHEETGFKTILDLLKGGNLAKWTLMTVCQTYFHPQRDVFIKPTTVKGVIEYFELENLHYRPMPSWAFYEAYRFAFLEMKSKVHPSLAPTNPAFSGFLLMSIHRRFF
ncbi:MAG TPA: hypothetical protein VK897_01245 [Anaerolineales bacterium]|nr:hypothetical protein [Anaerolineales bacterium]